VLNYSFFILQVEGIWFNGSEARGNEKHQQFSVQLEQSHHGVGQQQGGPHPIQGLKVDSFTDEFSGRQFQDTYVCESESKRRQLERNSEFP